MIGFGGGGGSWDIVGGSTVPEGEPLLAGVTFTSAAGGVISVIPTRDGITVPQATPVPTPTPAPTASPSLSTGGGGLLPGGGGGLPLGGGGSIGF